MFTSPTIFLSSRKTVLVLGQGAGCETVEHKHESNLTVPSSLSKAHKRTIVGQEALPDAEASEFRPKEQSEIA